MVTARAAIQRVANAVRWTATRLGADPIPTVVGCVAAPTPSLSYPTLKAVPEIE